MLIVNDAHLALAGMASLEERCPYCSKPLAIYPLIMSDDVMQTVYHVACALELATDLLVDLATFFHPPAPSPSLFVLTTPNAVSSPAKSSERVEAKGVIHAINEYLLHQDSSWRSHKSGYKKQSYVSPLRIHMLYCSQQTEKKAFFGVKKEKLRNVFDGPRSSAPGRSLVQAWLLAYPGGRPHCEHLSVFCYL